jgi:hypothetical protein
MASIFWFFLELVEAAICSKTKDFFPQGFETASAIHNSFYNFQLIYKTLCKTITSYDQSMQTLFSVDLEEFEDVGKTERF